MSNPRAPPPAQPPNTYTPGQLPLLVLRSAAAQNGHLIAAADFITQMLTANNIPHAFMGGFALNIRGSPRDTQDIDVAVGSNMQRLLEVVSAQDKLLRPLGNVSSVMRVFIEVSPPNLAEMYVEADLILTGSLGAPANLKVESEPVSVNTTAGQKQYTVLNLKALAAAKLGAFYSRSGSKDLIDLLFLVRRFPRELREIRAQLNPLHRQFFVDSYYKLARDDQNRAILRKLELVLGVVGKAT